MKTVQEMAAECAYITTDQRGRVTYELDLYDMERFAALVRAQALEEAKRVCLDKANEWGFDGRPKYACEDAAAAIEALKASVPPDQEAEGGVR